MNITLDNCPNINAFDAFYKCQRNLLTHNNVCVSISGGSDSDIMLDLIMQVVNQDKDIELSKIHFVFFDTGIEYKATKNHLDYLEKRYSIKIERIKASVPVPLGCRKFGLPFLSKFVSEMIERLQRHNFDFAHDGNADFEYLISKYPKCKAALNWWCNKNGEKSSFNISKFKLLKEFMILNPPDFKISPKCCNGAKKINGKHYTKQNNIDLNCIGVRQAENGIRSRIYQSCFSEGNDSDYYRPIFWFTDEDKSEYDRLYNIIHSDCYSVYGLKRTGCAGCPFGSKFETELEIIKKNEPKLYSAVCNIFNDSYEYTRKYRKFKEKYQKENV